MALEIYGRDEPFVPAPLILPQLKVQRSWDGANRTDGVTGLAPVVKAAKGSRPSN
jgi:hypothetical protein